MTPNNITTCLIPPPTIPNSRHVSIPHPYRLLAPSLPLSFCYPPSLPSSFCYPTPSFITMIIVVDDPMRTCLTAALPARKQIAKNTRTNAGNRRNPNLCPWPYHKSLLLQRMSPVLAPVRDRVQVGALRVRRQTKKSHILPHLQTRLRTHQWVLRRIERQGGKRGMTFMGRYRARWLWVLISRRLTGNSSKR